LKIVFKELKSLVVSHYSVAYPSPLPLSRRARGSFQIPSLHLEQALHRLSLALRERGSFQILTILNKLSADSPSPSGRGPG
jgi:hypothetical protein